MPRLQRQWLAASSCGCFVAVDVLVREEPDEEEEEEEDDRKEGEDDDGDGYSE
jgi:hypothetical protein